MTTTPLTGQQLDEIDASAAAATPGPWGTYQYGGDSLIEVAADLEDTGTGYSARRTVARFDEEPLDNDPTHREWTADEDWAQVQADAVYIAAMPPEVAQALVAEVRRLRAEPAAPRTLTESEHNAAWHAIEGAAGEEGADPGTVLNAVLHALGINPPAEETHVVADDSDDPEHVDDCPGCEAFTLTGHRYAAAAVSGAADSRPAESVISASEIELDGGDVMLQEMSVGDPIEIERQTGPLGPGCWVITAFESEDRSRARVRRLTREEIRAARHGEALARIYE